MRFKYVGQPKPDGSRELGRGTMALPSTDGKRSFRFPPGVPVDVDDELLAKRLSNSDHFEAVADEAQAPAPPTPAAPPAAKASKKPKGDDTVSP